MPRKRKSGSPASPENPIEILPPTEPVNLALDEAEVVCLSTPIRRSKRGRQSSVEILQVTSGEPADEVIEISGSASESSESNNSSSDELFDSDSFSNVDSDDDEFDDSATPFSFSEANDMFDLARFSSLAGAFINGAHLTPFLNFFTAAGRTYRQNAYPPPVRALDYSHPAAIPAEWPEAKAERWRRISKSVINEIKSFKYAKLKHEGIEIVNDKSTEEKCLVCLEEYKGKDVVKRLQCDHLFHNKCINRWLRSHSTCVVCKQSVVPNEMDLTKE